MVVIYADENSTAAKLIRDELLRRLVPCAVSRENKILQYALITVMYKDTEELLPDCDPETILIADTAAIYDIDRRKAELCRIASRVDDVFFIKYGFDTYTVSSGAVYDSLDYSRYAGRICRFSPSEKLIIRALLIMKEPYADAVTLQSFCLRSDVSRSAVAVHVNKINLDAYMCSPIKLISSKRLKGYYINRK